MGTTILIIAGVIVLFYFLGSSGKSSSNYQDPIKKDKKEAKEIKVPTVSSLVKNAKTIEDIKALDKKSQMWMKKFEDTGYEISKYERLFSVYEDAYCKAHDIIFYYQYIPDLELTSPQKMIDNAYLVVSIEEYKGKKKEVGGRADEWVEITANEIIDDTLENSIERKPDFFDSLVKYRQIVNSESPFHDKKELINELTENDKAFKKEFFFLGAKETVGDYWTKELLESYGVPLVDKLYKMGYDSPDKFLTLDIEQIKKMKGFGPKKEEQLKKAIRKIKNNIRPTRAKINA